MAALKFYCIFLVVLCYQQANAQHFSFVLTSETTVPITEDMRSNHATGIITNNSGTESLVLDIIRLENDMPGMWESGICTDICYYTFVDSTILHLAPNKSQDLKLYFRCLFGEEDTAHVKLLIQNQNDPQNSYIIDFYSHFITLVPGPPFYDAPDFLVKPTIFNSNTTISIPYYFGESILTISNASGQLVYNKTFTGIELKLVGNNFSKGIYYLQLKQGKIVERTKMIKL